ncbi:calcium-binding protein [Ascidiaceihabitans sp.]|uniref:calcium-binding protein n=1 Tax=Ascidiaceihabitans sp. TaxID=1872644 RepID=UPI0032998424
MPIAVSEDNRPISDRAEFGSRVVPLGNRDAADVWQQLVRAVELIGDAGIDYRAAIGGQNSNSTIASVLHSVGIDVAPILPDVPGIDSYPGSGNLLLNEHERIFTTEHTSHNDDLLYGGSLNDQFSMGDGNDTVVGGEGNDTVSGGAGDDLFVGGEGNDVFVGGSGADAFNGQDGVDRADYSGSIGETGTAINSGIIAEVGTNSDGALSADILDSWGGVDGLLSVEEIVGTSFDDVFALDGDYSAISSLFDSIDAGGEGNVGDTLDLSTAQTQDGLTISLEDEFIDANPFYDPSSGVVIEGFENVIGTDQADNIIGNSEANILSGGGGADELQGGAGNDRLVFDNADSLVVGGDDIDVAVFQSENDSEALIWDSANPNFDVEAVLGSDNSDIFYTSSGGGDIIAGGDGDDEIVVNWLSSSDHPTVVWGGAGADQITFSMSQYGGWEGSQSSGFGGSDSPFYSDFQWNTGQHEALGIMVIQAEGLTEDNFHLFNTDLIGGISSGFDWSEIDVILLNPDSGDTIRHENPDGTFVTIGTAAATGPNGEQYDTVDVPGGIGGQQVVDSYGLLLGDQTVTVQAAGANIQDGYVDQNGDWVEGTTYYGWLDGWDGDVNGGTILVGEEGSSSANGVGVFQSTEALGGVNSNWFVLGGQLSGNTLSGNGVYTVDMPDVDAPDPLEPETFDGTDTDENFDQSGLETPIVVNAGGGNDSVSDGSGDDTLNGGTGNDRFYAGDGADSYDGGEDTDQLYYTSSLSGLTIDMTNALNSTGIATGDTYANIEYLHGSNYSDLIVATTERVFGLDGDDTIQDGTGQQRMFGGEGRDIFRAAQDGGQQDRISDFTIGTDVLDLSLWGVTSLDDLEFSQETNRIILSYGGDSIRLDGLNSVGDLRENLNHFIFVPALIGGTSGADTVLGTAGNDSLKGFGGADSLDGGLGDDLVEAGGGNDTLSGGLLGNDTLDGGGGIDTADYFGLSVGVDVALNIVTEQNTGGGGIDTLLNIENLSGSVHADKLKGSTGENVLTGRGGEDTLNGLGGDDTLDGGAGADNLQGGNGNDLVIGGGGRDYILGGNGNDSVDAGVGSDSVFGGSGTDTLRGNDGIDLLYGGDGADLLFGDAGNDRLVGEAGQDTLVGGLGRDILAGGFYDTTNGYVGDGEADVFQFMSVAESPDDGATRTIIRDFELGIDKVDLSFIDADTNSTSDDTFSFIGNTAFTGTAGELKYSITPGGDLLLRADINGDGVANMQIKLDDLQSISATDFIL